MNLVEVFVVSFGYGALALGGGGITSLGICRNLGMHSIDVFCVDNIQTEVAFSRFCKKSFVVPDIERNAIVLTSFLESLQRKEKTRFVIFPASDLFCIALARLDGNLPENCVYLSNPAAIETLVNKKRFGLSLDKTDIPHPVTHILEESDCSTTVADKLNYPVLVKPAISQEFSKFKVKSFVANSPEELDECIAVVKKHQIQVILQEVLPGPPSNLFGVAGYMDRNNELKGVFAYRRIRDWPIDFGCNSIIESIPISLVADAKDDVVDYLRRIKYCGLFEAEFKRDDRDGVLKLLEINARCWWQNHFPTICGLNLVLIAFMDAIGKKVEYIEKYKTGVRWINSLNDFRAAIWMLRKGRLGFGEWLSSFEHVKDYSYFGANDLLPCVYHYSKLGFHFLSFSWNVIRNI